MTNETIAQVVKDNLCTGCGACIALCPEEAIKLTINEKKGIYVPELNEEKCTNCSICYKVCPSHEVDFKRVHYLSLTTKKIFLRMKSSEDKSHPFYPCIRHSLTLNRIISARWSVSRSWFGCVRFWSGSHL